MSDFHCPHCDHTSPHRHAPEGWPWYIAVPAALVWVPTMLVVKGIPGIAAHLALLPIEAYRRFKQGYSGE